MDPFLPILHRSYYVVDLNPDGDAPAASGSVGKPPAEVKDTSEVDELVKHRVHKDSSTVEFKVKWKGSDNLALVYNATKLELYYVFKILKRTKVPKGARPADNSKDAQYNYEHKSTLREIALDEFEKFKAKELARGAIESRKRKNIYGLGRPRKKVRGADN
ncbi:uncharacterized protein NECHADRAFT_106086 [Fusarium vanettenii 77-13-4]|uniref:Chromo domain-containing protein n=1 Tax=Fusarium vanettenii (strain ATCC MYA-4622 / CBS 123669 / FGSC 9596 / NRRL 45880 / 77-13-4) TaxID=660122 RepID=C7ZMF6_FUSV7|nr:uncharacterized protein NECHADRAFT_106086 [Fusarium vanettenii 77-13-4]EEU34793.1 hypothetical protein NECHADRAFT_106086 [Fusarium vanettenii 77-13-4]